MKMRTLFRHYWLNTMGVVAVLFGFVTPVIFSSVGVSVDMAQAYLVKARLEQALDAAALAGAASGSDDESEIQDVVDAYMEANYPEGRIGTKLSTVAELAGDEITVTGTARLDTSFMRIFGYDNIDVEAVTVVRREVRGLEVVMVLDNTGSMTTDNNIGTLRTATRNFIEILFENIGDPEFVKVGLVPYSSSVNVGPYGLGDDTDGDAYGIAFVEPPVDDVYADYYNGYNPWAGNDYAIDEDDLIYDPTEKGEWHGCVEAEDYPTDVEDSYVGPWTMYRHDYNGYDPLVNGTCCSCGSLNKGAGNCADVYNAAHGPNRYCPLQPIVPLSSDELFLDAAAQNMNASGNTLGNFGMVWGWRVLSPEEPFTEGVAYDDEEWDKVAVVMTDGINTVSPYYSAYGRANETSIDAGDLDDRFAEICEAMKQDNILIYTITFDDGVDDDTKDLFRACATSTSNYHDAPDQAELIDVFEQIARELSNLFIQQ
ncbi:MAG: TadE/TadG family type IV pilus assembly protein [Pseudomonadota bacterium]